MIPIINPAAMSSPKAETPDPYENIKKAACRRISDRWDAAVIADAKTLIMRSPWNLQNLENNHLVVNVRMAIRAGGDDLDSLVEAIIAVLAMTQYYLPPSWDQALHDLPPAKHLPLRAFFDDFEHPERNLRLQKFLAPRKSLGQRVRGMWTKVRDIFNVPSLSLPTTKQPPTDARTGPATPPSQAFDPPEAPQSLDFSPCHRHPSRQGSKLSNTTVTSITEQCTSSDADDERSPIRNTQSRTSHRSEKSDRSSRRSRFSEHLHHPEGSASSLC
ncbi:hypothetical protein VTI74DRAFT_9832 [Chaetomium olivicolor]